MQRHFSFIKDALSDPMQCISYLKMNEDWPATHSRTCPYITPTSDTATPEHLKSGRQSRKPLGKTRLLGESVDYIIKQTPTNKKNKPEVFLNDHAFSSESSGLNLTEVDRSFIWFICVQLFLLSPHFSQVKSFYYLFLYTY